MSSPSSGSVSLPFVSVALLCGALLGFVAMGAWSPDEGAAPAEPASLPRVLERAPEVAQVAAAEPVTERVEPELLEEAAEPMRTVRGRVADLSGKGVLGARVAVADEAASVVAGVDGAFELQVPRGRRVDVVATADGWSIPPVPSDLGSELLLVGRRVFTLDFDLRLPDGSAPAAARIELAVESFLRLEDASGRAPNIEPYSYNYYWPAAIRGDNAVSWSPGRASLSTRSGRVSGRAVAEVPGADGPIRYRSRLFSFDARIDGEGPHRIVLEPTADVTFTFAEPLPKPPYIALVRAEEAAGQPLGIQNVLAKPLGRQGGGVNARGLEAGNWIAVVGRNRDLPLFSTPFTVLPGSQEVPLELPEIRANELLEVEVRLDGELFSGPVRFTSSRARDLGRAGALPNAQGRRKISWESIRGEGPLPANTTTVDLTCSIEDLGELSMSVQVDQSIVRFDFRSPASIVIRGFEPRSGDLVAFLRPARSEGPKTVLYRFSRAVPALEIPAGEPGRIDGVQPGRYIVTVRSKSVLGYTLFACTPFLDRRIVDVVPGENVVTMTDPPRFGFEVEYTNLENPTLNITRDGIAEDDPRYVRYQVRARNGRASGPPLLPGRYQMRVYGGGDPVVVTFDVPCRVVRIRGAASGN